MKLLLDANLSPAWVPVLIGYGHQVHHWFTIGARNAPDTEILEWASREGYTIITKDLDFGTLLATQSLPLPSVIQLRIDDLAPSQLASDLHRAIQQCAASLQAGALLTLTQDKHRIRLLPIRRTPV